MKRILILVALLIAVPTLSIAQNYQGDYANGKTVYCFFSTWDSTGAMATLSGSPAVRSYKDSSDTESGSTGITLNVDADSRTGMNRVIIDTSQDTSFYAADHHFTVVITAGTVSGVSKVGTPVCSFSLYNRSLMQVGQALARSDASSPLGGTFDPSTDSLQAQIDSAISCTANCSSNFGAFFDNSAAASTAILGNVTTIKGKTDQLVFTVTNRVDSTPNGTFNVQKNIAFPNFPIWMLSPSGNGVTGAAVTCRVQKDGGAWSSSTTNPITEIGLGLYNWNATAAELNANKVAVQCTATGAQTYRTNVTPQH